MSTTSQVLAALLYHKSHVPIVTLRAQRRIQPAIDLRSAASTVQLQLLLLLL
jgi:hypothetical protein